MTRQLVADRLNRSTKGIAPKRLGKVTRTLIAGGAMDVFQGDAFIWSAPEAVRPGEISVRGYQALTRQVRQSIEEGASNLSEQNAQRAIASAMLAVQAQALALDVAKQQINLLRLDMLEADEIETARLQEEIVNWQTHAETLRDGLDASRDQLDRLQLATQVPEPEDIAAPADT